MRIQTSQKAELFMHILKTTVLGLFALLVSTLIITLTFSTQTEAATSSDINFQARLENATGSIAANGTYNVEFKLYNALSSSGSSQGSCTGDANCLWTEDYLVGSAQGVQVVNGYLTVNLGSITAFPTNMNWHQQLWLTMRIGGTGGSPSWDTEMSPRLLLTATPYSFQAAQLSVTNSTYVGTLSFASTLTGTDTITIPDTAGAGGTICLQSSASCGFAPTSGSANYINNTTSTQNANFYVTAATSGTVAGVLRANASGSGDILDYRDGAGAIVGTVNSTGNLLVVPDTNSNAALLVENSTGKVVLRVDTSANKLTLGNVTSVAGNNEAGNLIIADGTTDNYAMTVNIPTLTNNHTIQFPDAGGTVCLQTATACGFAASSGSGSYIQNGTTTQATANFNIQSTNATSVGGVIEGASGQTANLLDLQDSTGANLSSIDSSGDQESLGYFDNGIGGIGQFGNVLTNSETIGGTGWSLSNSETATQNATTAPNGQTTAAKIQNGGSSSAATFQQITTNSLTSPYTFSFWVESGNSTKISYGIYDATASSWVGALQTVSTLSTTWQRLSFTGTPGTAGHTLKAYLYADGSTSTTSGNYNYVWGAQVVQASTAGVYISTTGSVVNPGYGICYSTPNQ